MHAFSDNEFDIFLGQIVVFSTLQIRTIHDGFDEVEFFMLRMLVMA